MSSASPRRRQGDKYLLLVHFARQLQTDTKQMSVKSKNVFSASACPSVFSKTSPLPRVNLFVLFVCACTYWVCARACVSIVIVKKKCVILQQTDREESHPTRQVWRSGTAPAAKSWNWRWETDCPAALPQKTVDIEPRQHIHRQLASPEPTQPRAYWFTCSEDYRNHITTGLSERKGRQRNMLLVLSSHCRYI